MRKILIGALVVFVIIFILSFVFNQAKLPSFDYDNVKMVQLQQPKDGQDIAIINTTVGEFKVALYKEYAPKTVENFINLANQGYYDGKYIYKIQDDTFFFAGTTNKNGVIVGKDDKNYETENKTLDIEKSDNLWALKGSLISMGPDYKGAGTFITGVNTMKFDDKLKNKLKKAKNANTDIVNAFLDKGGVPVLPHEYTIFAQTYEGMDSFEKVFKVDVDKKGAPKEDIKINSIKISTYSSNGSTK